MAFDFYICTLKLNKDRHLPEKSFVFCARSPFIVLPRTCFNNQSSIITESTANQTKDKIRKNHMDKRVKNRAPLISEVHHESTEKYYDFRRSGI